MSLDVVLKIRLIDMLSGPAQKVAQHNTFHINGGDPRAAAREIERRLARLGNSNNALFGAVPT